MLKYFYLFILFVSFTPIKLYSGCVDANTDTLMSGYCIKPSGPNLWWDFLSNDNKKNKDQIRNGYQKNKNKNYVFGWNLRERHVWRNPDIDKEKLKFIPYMWFDKDYASSVTLRSKQKQGGRCNLFYNMEGMFFEYKDSDNNKLKTREEHDDNLRWYLKRFQNFTKNWEKNEGQIGTGDLSRNKLKALGFKGGSSARYAERMVRDYNDRGYLVGHAKNNDNGKSACETLGICPCEKHYRCTSIDSLMDLSEPIVYGNQSYTRTKNSSIPAKYSHEYHLPINKCYKLADCNGNSDGNIKDFCKQKQNEDGEERDFRCHKYPNKCLYVTECKSPASKPFDGAQTCNHDFQCGSGYCQRFSNKIVTKFKEDPAAFNFESLMGKIKKGSGVCLPMARCIPKCTKENKKLKDSVMSHCCPGLVNSGGTCQSIGLKVTRPPEFELDRRNEQSCSIPLKYEAGMDHFCLGAEQWNDSQSDCEKTYSIKTEEVPQDSQDGVSSYDQADNDGYSESDNETQEEDVCYVDGVRNRQIDIKFCFGGMWSEKIGVKLPYLYYTRLFEGLQWLWGQADSEGTNHTFGHYKNARDTMKLFFEKNSDIEDSFYAEVDSIRSEFSQSSQTEGGASGISALTAISKLYEALEEIDTQRSDLFNKISGQEAIPFEHQREQKRIKSVDIDSSDYEEVDNYVFKKTFAKLIKGLNSNVGHYGPSDKDRHEGQYSLAQGYDWKCGFGRKIWKSKNNVCYRNDDKPAKCFWGGGGQNRKSLTDGDCVKEGWRIDDLYGPFHGTQGKGGVLDGIYPKSIRSSMNHPSQEPNLPQQFIDYFKKLSLAAKAYAGATNQEIGKDISPISLGQLRLNIKRDWSSWADELVGVNGECQGPYRKRVPAIVTFEEGYIHHLQNTKSEDIKNKIDFRKDWRKKSFDEKRKIYHDIVSNILTDFFVGFHWHSYSKRKETYRFFRDRKNHREYDGAIKLYNAALWLKNFYAKNVEANAAIKECLSGRVVDLTDAMNSNNSMGNAGAGIGNPDFLKLLGDNSTSHPEGCPGPDSNNPNNPSNNSSSDLDSSGFGNFEIVNNGLGEGVGNKETGQYDSDAFNAGNVNKSNVTENGGTTTGQTPGTNSGTGASLVGDSKNAKSETGNSSAKSRNKGKKKLVKLSKEDQKKINNLNLKEAFNKFAKTPSLKTILGPQASFGEMTSALTPVPFTDSSPSNKSEMSDEEAEAYELLQALQAQNDGSGSGGDDIDFDDDEDEEGFEDVTTSGNDSGVDPELVRAMEKNLDKYKAKEDDNLWKKISKTYMREGLKRLVRKRKYKKKNIPSLKNRKGK